MIAAPEIPDALIIGGTATAGTWVRRARESRADGSGLAAAYARLAGERHRGEGVGRGHQPFDGPGEADLAAAWRDGYDTAPPPHGAGEATHAARVHDHLERAAGDAPPPEDTGEAGVAPPPGDKGEDE
jgi:hypothetical protein